MSEIGFRCRGCSCLYSRASPTSFPVQGRQVKFAEIGSTPLVRSVLRMQSFDEAKIVFNQQILCRKSLGKLVIQVTGYQICGVGKLRILKQRIDHPRIHLVSIQISRRLHRQAKLGNIIIQAVRGIDLAKQEVGGDIEHTGNANDIFVTQLVRLAADETAQRTFRTADASGKLSLCDFSGFHQVLYAVTDFTGEISLFHCGIPFLMVCLLLKERSSNCGFFSHQFSAHFKEIGIVCNIHFLKSDRNTVLFQILRSSTSSTMPP